ncbi:hypothetical protein [Teredinibacter turnerae]|uniref:hypothetical protein n=1 Tax=Teredinibacter turnerae TaxID=2426 RepID=UPI00037E8980|nr:hypothetical protein [Teredinibacter turnerae]
MKVLLILICAISAAATAAELKPFTTDGCSLFPDGDTKDHVKWMECCIRHDYAYWKGGSGNERILADGQLQRCVADLGEENLSYIMHLGVQLGGAPYFPTWYRWGYGWPYMRGYKELNGAEKAQVKTRIIQLNELLTEFLTEAK